MVNWYGRLPLGVPKAAPAPRVRPDPRPVGRARPLPRARDGEPSVALCDDGRLELFETATHWLQHDEADAVNDRSSASCFPWTIEWGPTEV